MSLLGRLVKNSILLTGFDELVSPVTHKERWAICQKCPKLTEKGKCSICGCDMYEKTQLKYSKCDEDKW